MQVKVTKIKTKNPATYLLNCYRSAASKHINGALDTIIANHGNNNAVMATLNQIYEDAQQFRIIGLINDREYDAIAAIAFDVVCGDITHLDLPHIHYVNNSRGEKLRTLNELKTVMRESIAEPVNSCLRCLTAPNNEWKQEGWNSEEEYHQGLLQFVHNIMRVGKIIGITTEHDHHMVTMHMQECIAEKKFRAITLGT